MLLVMVSEKLLPFAEMVNNSSVSYFKSFQITVPLLKFFDKELELVSEPVPVVREIVIFSVFETSMFPLTSVALSSI